MDFFVALAHECATKYDVALDAICPGGPTNTNVFLWFPKVNELARYPKYVFAVFDTSQRCTETPDALYEGIKERLIFSKFMPHSNAHDRWFVVLKPLCEVRP